MSLLHEPNGASTHGVLGVDTGNGSEPVRVKTQASGFELRPYQVDTVNRARQALQQLPEGDRRIMVASPTGSGKCLSPDTPIAMADGTTRRIDDVYVGDQLLGDDGTFRTVLGRTDGISPMYSINPTCRGFDTWGCNDKHTMTLVSCADTSTAWKNEVVDIDIGDYLGLNKTAKHVLKQFATGFDGWGEVDFPIDPYMIGLWLGDGSRRHTTIWTQDTEVVDAVYEHAQAVGAEVTIRNPDRCPGYSVVTKRGQPNPTWSAFQEFVIDDKKTIPAKYLASARWQRERLLAGLLDTDGYLHNGCHEIAQASEPLANAITFLARSLGLRVSRSVKYVKGSPYQRMNISGDMHLLPMRVPRRIVPKRRQKKNPLRTGFEVKANGVGRYVGLVVDGNQRFLKGDFTVVHNTVMAALGFLKPAQDRGKRVLFVVASLELLDQSLRTFESVGLRCGVQQAQHDRTDMSKPIQVCSQATVRGWIKSGRYRDYQVDMVIHDEADQQFQVRDTLAELYPNAPVIGLSASPFAKGLGNFYRTCIQSISTFDLIEKAYLSPFEVFAPSQPNMKGAKLSGGDYQAADAAERYDSALVADIVQTWHQRARGRKTLMFACNVAHSKHLVEQFVTAGVNAVHVDGYPTNPDDLEAVDRFEKIDAFRRGEIEILSSVALCSRGFDVPDVEALIMARPTKSLSLFVQIIGRGLRIAPGKESCIILDHAGAHLRHGFVTDDLDMTLDDGTQQKHKPDSRKKGEKLPTPCPSCGYLKPHGVHACPSCGFAPQKQNTVVNVDGELVPLEQTKKPKKKEYSQSEKKGWYGGLLHIARERGYSDGWAYHKFGEKFGHKPQGYAKQSYTPLPEVLSWVRSQQIRYAKSKSR